MEGEGERERDTRCNYSIVILICTYAMLCVWYAKNPSVTNKFPIPRNTIYFVLIFK